MSESFNNFLLLLYELYHNVNLMIFYSIMLQGFYIWVYLMVLDILYYIKWIISYVIFVLKKVQEEILFFLDFSYKFYCAFLRKPCKVVMFFLRNFFKKGFLKKFLRNYVFLYRIKRPYVNFLRAKRRKFGSHINFNSYIIYRLISQFIFWDFILKIFVLVFFKILGKIAALIYICFLTYRNIFLFTFYILKLDWSYMFLYKRDEFSVFLRLPAEKKTNKQFYDIVFDYYLKLAGFWIKIYYSLGFFNWFVFNYSLDFAFLTAFTTLSLYLLSVFFIKKLIYFLGMAWYKFLKLNHKIFWGMFFEFFCYYVLLYFVFGLADGFITPPSMEDEELRHLTDNPYIPRVLEYAREGWYVSHVDDIGLHWHHFIVYTVKASIEYFFSHPLPWHYSMFRPLKPHIILSDYYLWNFFMEDFIGLGGRYILNLVFPKIYFVGKFVIYWFCFLLINLSGFVLTIIIYFIKIILWCIKFILTIIFGN